MYFIFTRIRTIVQSKQIQNKLHIWTLLDILGSRWNFARIPKKNQVKTQHFIFCSNPWLITTQIHFKNLIFQFEIPMHRKSSMQFSATSSLKCAQNRLNGSKKMFFFSLSFSRSTHLTPSHEILRNEFPQFSSNHPQQKLNHWFSPLFMIKISFRDQRQKKDGTETSTFTNTGNLRVYHANNQSSRSGRDGVTGRHWMSGPTRGKRVHKRRWAVLVEITFESIA